MPASCGEIVSWYVRFAILRIMRLFHFDRIKRQFGSVILLAYPCVALLMLVVLTFVTPPFFGSDEMAHAERALEIAHGEWVPTRAREGSMIAEFPDAIQPEDKPLAIRPTSIDGPAYGAELDTGFVAAAMLSTYPQRAFVRAFPQWTRRPDGRFPSRILMLLRTSHWSGQTIFTNFQNTAVYPAPLYLPAALGLGLGEKTRLTILQALYLSRLLTAVCAVVLGWFALWLAGPERPLVFCVLLVPALLNIEASCSQDALLIPLMVVVFALVVRAVRQCRQFAAWEFAWIAISLALAVMARPPYIWLLVVLALPSLELAGRGARLWLQPAAATGFTLMLIGWWRYLIRASYLTHSAIAKPPAQIAFVKAHPLRTLAVLIKASLNNIPSLYVHAVEILEARSVATTAIFFGLHLLAFALIVVLCRKVPLQRTSSRAVLFVALLAVSETMFFAEYLIWNAPGSGQIDGVQARYYLPFFCFAFLLGSRRPVEPVHFALPGKGIQRSLLGMAMATYFAGVAYTPFLLAHRYYNMNLFATLHGMVGS